MVGQHIANALLHRLRNDEPGLRRSFRCEGRVYVDGLPIFTGVALGLHRVGQCTQIIGDRRNARLRRVGTIEPLRLLGIEVERAIHGIRIINILHRRCCGIALAVAEENLIGKAKRLAVRPGAA